MYSSWSRVPRSVQRDKLSGSLVKFRLSLEPYVEDWSLALDISKLQCSPSTALGFESILTVCKQSIAVQGPSLNPAKSLCPLSLHLFRLASFIQGDLRTATSTKVIRARHKDVMTKIQKYSDTRKLPSLWMRFELKIVYITIQLVTLMRWYSTNCYQRCW